MKLLYIDACFRGEASRTRRIATSLIEALSEKYEVERIDLNALSLSPIQKPMLDARFRGEIDATALSWAKQVQEADRIVIAAPFWDMSFPAALKVFFEQCSLLDVTFSNGEGRCVGRCRAEKLLYITSRGMDISTGAPLEQATPYLRALSWLWGIGQLSVISAQNLDYVSAEEEERRVESAIEEGLALVKDF